MNKHTLSALRAAAAATCLLATLAPAQANLLSNGSFESPARGSDTYCYLGGGCALAGWSGDAVVIARDSGAWGWPDQPAGYSYGQQLVGLQTVLAVEQQLNLGAGQYSLGWADSGRASYYGGARYGAARYQVLWDNLLLGSFDVQPGEAWARNSLSFTATGAGTLRFQGVYLNADTTAFIDDLVLTRAGAVPEPASLPLAGLGLLAAGLALRRRARR